MQICYSIQEVRQAVRKKRLENPDVKVGFVPTMGFLHQGHASLLETTRSQCEVVVLSIFVNPLQFGPNEDLARYPRDEERDMLVAEAAGTDIVFFPQVEEMYPSPTKTIVTVSGVTESLCGASRPGHFDGVATVVTKLFNIIQPDFAYFGLKDAQQVAVVEQMVYDLNIPVNIVPCPIIREEDGLALSSRNVYLSEEERRQAKVLSESLSVAEELLKKRENGLSVEQLQQAVIRKIQTAPLAVIDYAEILTYPSLESMVSLEKGNRLIIALAVKFGNTRLIDNRIFKVN